MNLLVLIYQAVRKAQKSGRAGKLYSTLSCIFYRATERIMAVRDVNLLSDCAYTYLKLYQELNLFKPTFTEIFVKWWYVVCGTKFHCYRVHIVTLRRFQFKIGWNLNVSYIFIWIDVLYIWQILNRMIKNPFLCFSYVKLDKLC